MNKSLRIRKNEEFSKIIAYKHSVVSKTFVVYYQKKSDTNARVGISVSKKIGNAVVRNRVKRQIREMFRSLLDFNTYDFDVIVIVRKSFISQTFITNKNDLEKLLKQAIIKQYE